MIDTKIYRRQRNIWGWILVLPTVVGIVVTMLYPFTFSFILSFTNIRSNLNNLHFNNFENYKWLFSANGQEFWYSLWISLRFALVTTVIQTVLAFVIAYMLYQFKGKKQTVFRILLYLPCLLPVPVVATMWRFIYEYDVGLLFNLSKILHITPVSFLTDPSYVFWAVIITNTWMYLPIPMVYYLVAMGSIQQEMLESARIDGANRFRILIRFIFPLTFEATRFNIIMSVIGGMKSYELFMLLEGCTVPATRTAGYVIFRSAYTDNRMGWSLAMSMVLSVLLGTLSFIVNKFLNKGEPDYV